MQISQRQDLDLGRVQASSANFDLVASACATSLLETDPRIWAGDRVQFCDGLMSGSVLAPSILARNDLLELLKSIIQINMKP